MAALPVFHRVLLTLSNFARSKTHMWSYVGISLAGTCLVGLVRWDTLYLRLSSAIWVGLICLISFILNHYAVIGFLANVELAQ
ncbi:hypothetical protein ACS8CT_22995, partial [Yersinia enterocolitica]|uniref:hypothetical protein n=1 Tax=Yersinia enterocolitica TaxID=630 RepID=UPI003F471004